MFLIVAVALGFAGMQWGALLLARMVVIPLGVWISCRNARTAQALILAGRERGSRSASWRRSTGSERRLLSESLHNAVAGVSFYSLYPFNEHVTRPRQVRATP